jgi:hypothetical protein
VSVCVYTPRYVSGGSFAIIYLYTHVPNLLDADDIVFKRSNSKQSNGAVGLLTGDRITRASYYVHACHLALIPFVNRALYFPSSSETETSSTTE